MLVPTGIARVRDGEGRILTQAGQEEFFGVSSHACTFSGLFSSGSDMSTRRRRKGGSEADEVAMAGSPRSGDGNKLSEKLRAKADETKEQLLRKVKKKGVCFYLHDDCGSVRYGVLVVVVAVFGTDEWGSACVSCLSRFFLRVWERGGGFACDPSPNTVRVSAMAFCVQGNEVKAKLMDGAQKSRSAWRKVVTGDEKKRIRDHIKCAHGGGWGSSEGWALCLPTVFSDH